jgi:hypothetical protein
VSFATILGLLVSLLVAAPIAAHLLRRKRTDVVVFPPARLVPAAPPVARHRSRLEDRSLFGIRAMAVLALALLGATPFVRCSRLSVGRQGGGSVALMLVVDDSLSMRARLGKGTRFSRAVEGAGEVLSSLREGDAVAIIAAGAPARVSLAATTDLGAARKALSSLRESDRATDIDGALALAASLSRSLPHPDRRVVLLSDLADGRSAPIGEQAGAGAAPVWVPLAELRERLPDCGVVRATRRGGSVEVRVACGAEADADGRRLECLSDAKVVASAPLAHLKAQDVELSLADGTTGPLIVRLAGADAVAADDAAPVVLAASVLQIAVVSDLSEGGMVTGGPSAVEQAIAALDETVAVRPLPTIPEDAEALSPFGAVVLDDPPGLTPEARSAFKAWLDRGGVGMLLLGPRAGGAILGAAFEPFVPGPVRWSTSAPKGVDLASAGAFGAAAEGLASLAPRGRALLDARAPDGATLLARWTDGAPLVLTRRVGRGEALVVGLPGSLDASDLPLRPAFLQLIERVLEAGRAREVGRRSPVGAVWPLRDGVPSKILGPAGPVSPRQDGGGAALVPELAGLYLLERDGQSEVRVAEIEERETDLTPRPVSPQAAAEQLGSERAAVDASPYVAFVLLAAIAAEAALRLWTRRREAQIG